MAPDNSAASVTCRLLTPKELADLSDDWENPTVDLRFYFQNVMVAYETDQATYEQHKREGGLCQQHAGKFYIA